MDKILFLIFAFLISNIKAQDSRKHILLPDYFNDTAIVFGATHRSAIKAMDIEARFTPTLKQIELAEIAIEKNKGVCGFSARQVRKSKRQYYGLLDSTEKQYIVICLLYFKTKKAERNRFQGWKKDFFVGFGSYYEKRIRVLKYDIEQDKIVLPCS